MKNNSLQQLKKAAGSGHPRCAWLLAAVCLLAACGGGGGSPDTSDAADQLRPPAYGLLKPVESESELENSLRGGLLGAAYTTGGEELFFIDELEASSAEAEGGDGSAPASDRFSTTNLQEAGVEEADIVKYDGEILYVVDFADPQVFYLAAEAAIADTGIVEPQPPAIRLLRTDPDTPSAQVLAEVTLPSNEFVVDGLYLHGEGDARQMLAVARSQSFFYWEAFASDYFWRNGRTLVQSWRVDDPEQPSSAWSLEIDGSLLASRRIENTLYLVSRYSPTLEELLPYPQKDADIAANRAVIEATPLASLLPRIRREDGVSRELLAATDCYVPNAAYTGLTLPPAGGSLITVTAIDLDAPESVNSICLNTYASGFYASTESIYVTANGAANSTLIHKVSLLDGGPEYRGSGEVPGYIGTGSPAFLMSERGGDLRVVSSSWEGRFFPLPVIAPEVDQDNDDSALEDDGFGRHRLTVLREASDGTALNPIARLPNARHPEPIGKPEEDVYAARFLGDRAYIVTFEVIDPLYVLNLADPEEPVITGELEIPGFSTLLQPLGENLLLGIGHDVPGTGPRLLQGVKLALFDVADLDSPRSLDQLVVGRRGSSSPALYNHHSLTLLEIDGRYRVALPIERYDEDVAQQAQPGDPWYYYGWSDSGLHLFDVDPGAGTITASGRVIVEERSEEQPYPGFGLYNSRSVLHDDAVFFINSGEVFPLHWGQGEDEPGEPARGQ